MTQKIYILEFMRNNFLSQSNKTYMSEHMKNIHKRNQIAIHVPRRDFQ